MNDEQQHIVIYVGIDSNPTHAVIDKNGVYSWHCDKKSADAVAKDVNGVVQPVFYEVLEDGELDLIVPLLAKRNVDQKIIDMGLSID